MADYTYEQLKDMQVGELREIAKTIQSDELTGYSTWHKDHLLPVLCKVLGIHTHHAAAGPQKSRIKVSIRKLKADREKSVTAKDLARLATIRKQIHCAKRTLRRMADGAPKAAPAEAKK